MYNTHTQYTATIYNNIMITYNIRNVINIAITEYKYKQVKRKTINYEFNELSLVLGVICFIFNVNNLWQHAKKLLSL